MWAKKLPGLLICLFLAVSCVPAPRPAQQPLSLILPRVESLVAEGRYAEAVELLEGAARTFPKSPVPLIKLGQIYLGQQRWLLAEDAFNRALARDLDHPLATAGLAETLFNQDRLAEALKLWQQVTATAPQLPGAFTGLGRTYLWLFDFEAAQAAFREQQTYRDDPEAHWYLAALTAPQDLSAALIELQAISPLEDEAQTPDSGGGLSARRGYLLAALAPFTAESPQTEVAKATGIALAQVQLWPLAVHALTLANEQSEPGEADAETLAFLGYALAQSGRPALDILEQAQQADPQSALPLYFQGIYLRRQGAYQAAEQLFTKAIELDPENAAIYIELAQTRAVQGDLATAETLYQSAIDVSDNPAQFQLLLARFYADNGYRVEEAGIPTVEALLETDEDNADAYDLLGWMQFLVGAEDEAVVSLLHALELNPQLISAHYHLGRLREAQGLSSLALTEYQWVIEQDIFGTFRELAWEGVRRLRADDE
jgi:tetratricopeptide (TPR) repeat protein